ncbi:MAG TPA: hypothetical protein VN950_03250 [Terriglobales bacterium]|nr:hypothetical protein [Terriglobales bacterium]
MIVAKTQGFSWWLFAVLLFVGGSYSAVPTLVGAQCNNSKGFNAAYGICGGSNATPQGSFAMVDAFQYNSTDICTAIYDIFLSYNTGNSNGVVVDARGFNSGQVNCSVNPWSVSAEPSMSVILLPSGTITISAKWTLPSNARVIGEGPNLTILKAASGFSGEMIDMGTPALCMNKNDCPGISIEHLGLNGNSQPGVSGIVNNNAQELSYVDDVAFSNMLPTSSGSGGIALYLNGQYSFNSGPYTNLIMSNVGTCVWINGPEDTRGIHGLTCKSLPPTSPAAIYLDSSNNSLEDIAIDGSNTGSQDGILIGQNAPAENNVLFNVSGSGLKNVVHISSQTNSNSSHNCPPLASGTVHNVCDVTVLEATNSSGSPGNIIEDDLTGTTLSGFNLGMYIVGEPVNGGSSSIGYSRLTSSLLAPAWLVGTGAPSSNSTCAVGSLYSRTSGASGTNTIYGCVGGSTPWAVIK